MISGTHLGSLDAGRKGNGTQNQTATHLERQVLIQRTQAPNLSPPWSPKGQYGESSTFYQLWTLLGASKIMLTTPSSLSTWQIICNTHDRPFFSL